MMLSKARAPIDVVFGQFRQQQFKNTIKHIYNVFQLQAKDFRMKAASKCAV